MLKIAYEYGQRKCLHDAGLTKEAATLKDLAIVAPLIGAGVGGLSGAFDAMSAPKDRQVSRELHGIIGGGVGGLTGGGIGLLGGLLAHQHLRAPGEAALLGTLLGSVAGGLYGGNKLVGDSRDNDPLLSKLRHRFGLED